MNDRFKWKYPSEGLRYPRTLEEAFGPGTSRNFSERYDPMPSEDKATIFLGAVVLVVILFMALVGWL